MALASIRPPRLLLLGALASLAVAPLAVALVARAEGFNAVAVRWNFGWGLVLPLPRATAWIALGLFGLATYLVVAVPTYLLCRSRAGPERNRATLLALAGSAVAALLALLTWLDLWRP